MRVVVAGLALLFGSAAFAQQSLAMPEVEVPANRVQRVPSRALSLELPPVCEIPVQPAVSDPSDPLTLASGPFAEVADVQSLDRLAPLVSINWSEGFHFVVVGANVLAWRHLQFAPPVWRTSC